MDKKQLSASKLLVEIDETRAGHAMSIWLYELRDVQVVVLQN